MTYDIPTPSKDSSVTAISDLEIFARVARTGNMSAAGREMGLSPAVVSKRVSLLEERLGTRLFQRTTRQLTLTETGEGYFKRVVDILSLVEEAEDFVSRRNTKPRGIIKVSVPTSFGRQHVTPHLGAFLVKFPDIAIDVQLADGYVDIIREGFDLAIRIGDLEDSSLVARKLATETRVLCASPGYLAHAPALAAATDLEHHNCLTVGPVDSWLLQGPEGRLAVKTGSSLRTNSCDFVHEALLAGLGVGLRPTWEVGADIECGRLVRVLPAYQGAGNAAIHAVYPSRDFLPAKVNIFIEHLAAIFANDGAWPQGGTSAGAAPAKGAQKLGGKARVAAR